MASLPIWSLAQQLALLSALDATLMPPPTHAAQVRYGLALAVTITSHSLKLLEFTFPSPGLFTPDCASDAAYFPLYSLAR